VAAHGTGTWYAILLDSAIVIRSNSIEHIRYSQTERVRYIDDKNVAKMLETNRDKKAAIEAAIAGIKLRRQDYLNEQTRINQIAARFGSFLKNNAIMPYNDAIKSYVKMAIREAKRVAAETSDYRRVQGLEKCLEEYEEERLMIENCLKEGKEQIGAFDIQRAAGASSHGKGN